MSRPIALHPVAALLLAAACSDPHPPLSLEVWHGERQRVGHLGDAQDDFNLMGRATAKRLTYSIDGGEPVELTLPRDATGFRRLGAAWHFNADIPITSLDAGENQIVLRAEATDGEVLEERIVVERLSGTSALPFAVDWSELQDPQAVGQYVDGRWELTSEGLRSPQLAYDRLFLIGDRSWTDYEVRVAVTLHEVAADTAPYSGGNGVGLILRFAGHSVGGPLDFPEAQPKWGYLPFGHIGWLRWKKGEPDAAPEIQSYRGDRNELADFGTVAVGAGDTVHLAMRCETQREAPSGEAVTRYLFKAWPAGAEEPESWSFDVLQTSDFALRSGGVALVTHHVDATFGDLMVVPVEPHDD